MCDSHKGKLLESGFLLTHNIYIWVSKMLNSNRFNYLHTICDKRIMRVSKMLNSNKFGMGIWRTDMEIKCFYALTANDGGEE